MIPKIIHYCWFGPNHIPVVEQGYIEGWKVMFPDYEIMFWNEQSFDLKNAVPYVKQAYNAKKYAFVSDYVRMYALQKYGGIYFDTDVEVVKDLNVFHDDRFFIGFENKTMLGTGIIGSEPNMWILNEMIEYYQNHEFVDKNGLPDTTTNVQILVSILSKYGFVKENKEQIINGLHIYERDIFNPKKLDNQEGVFRSTERTVTIHHMAGSWLTERERKRGTNKFWRNICRPILKYTRTLLIKVIGESNSKKIEVKLRGILR